MWRVARRRRIMNNKEVDKLLDWLYNYNIYIAPSKIHGIGIFAAQNIKKNTPLFYYNNENALPIEIKQLIEIGIKKSVIKILKRLYHARNGYIFLKPKQDLTWVNLINHSLNPNVIHKDSYYISIKNIKTHEELTINYLKHRNKLNFKPNEKINI